MGQIVWGLRSLSEDSALYSVETKLIRRSQSPSGCEERGHRRGSWEAVGELSMVQTGRE